MLRRHWVPGDRCDVDRELAEHHGILQWIRVEVPNAHPLFIETLGDLVVRETSYAE